MSVFNIFFIYITNLLSDNITYVSFEDGLVHDCRCFIISKVQIMYYSS